MPDRYLLWLPVKNGSWQSLTEEAGTTIQSIRTRYFTRMSWRIFFRLLSKLRVSPKDPFLCAEYLLDLVLVQESWGNSGMF
jgi:hypothetical protein